MKKPHRVPTVTDDQRMPDGKPFQTWRDRTVYSRAWVVDPGHPAAADGNQGTAARPLRTIGAAVRRVRPGERVVVKSGVYREAIEPRCGGTGPDRMVSIEAAPGARVVVSGSEILTAPWVRSRDPNARGWQTKYARRLWMTTLPAERFGGDDSPFRLANASDADMDLMPWAVDWKGRIPYTLRRGLLFQDGRRLTQLGCYEDLARVPGSYWVAPDGLTVHLHACGSVDPNAGARLEATARGFLLKPRSPGLGFIRVAGLEFEHAGNGYARIGTGALFTMGGHHWLIEDNTFREISSVAVEIGYDIHERADPARVVRTDPNLGGVIVRRNRVSDCGTGGIQGHGVREALVEDNDLRRIGWQMAEYYWEVAAIKLLITTRTLVRRNTILDADEACGIWLDWDNRWSRVTGNLIARTVSANGAIFIEASQTPNLVDHNVIWGVNGQGIRLADSDATLVAHNCIAHTTEPAVRACVATKRTVNGKPVTSRRNRVLNNVFIDCAGWVDFQDRGNIADGNVYSDSTGQLSLRAWRRQGRERNGALARVAGVADLERLTLTWSASPDWPAATVLKECDRGYWGEAYGSHGVSPGPLGPARREPATAFLRPGR